MREIINYKGITKILLLLFLFPFSACEKEDDLLDNQIDNQYSEIESWFDFLCSPELGGRYSGSEGIKKAENYICDIIGRSDSLICDSFQTSKCEMTNIIYHIEGESDSLIVIGAHYDAYGYKNHTPLPGADDNLSGVAVVLLCIKHFQTLSFRPQYSYDICFWDGEEIGRYGSKHYLSSYCKKGIKLYINVDTCGSIRDYLLSLSHNKAYEWLKSEFATMAMNIGAVQVEYNLTTGSTDCEQFEKNHIPFICIGCLKVPRYLHTYSDNVSHISFSRINDISKVLIEYLEK